VVINNLDTVRSCILPTEADAPSIVDSNAVLTRTIASKHLKTVAGWNHQIIKPISDFELSELSTRNLGNVDESPNRMPF